MPTGTWLPGKWVVIGVVNVGGRAETLNTPPLVLCAHKALHRGGRSLAFSPASVGSATANLLQVSAFPPIFKTPIATHFPGNQVSVGIPLRLNKTVLPPLD